MKTNAAHLLGAFSAAFALTVGATPSQAASFDALDDFDPAGNPTCAGWWSYGSASALDGSFTLFADSARTNALDFWGADLSVAGGPLVVRNDRPCVQINAYGTTVLPGRQVALQPGATGEFAIARWVAPSGGTYAVAAVFTGVDAGPASTVDVHVLVNTNPRFAGLVNGYGSMQSTSFVVTLVASDIVVFAAGNGGDGASNDTVALNAGIELADITLPVVTATATPARLWPPNNKTVLVTVSGKITDNSGPVDSCDAWYDVVDEYGLIHPTGLISIGAGGDYSFTVPLVASRNGADLNGRQYEIWVNGRDESGNAASFKTVVIVPHDQRQK